MPQLAAFAGPPGPAFSFSVCPSFSQRFLSEWGQRWFSLAWASLVSFPYLSSIPHTALHRPSCGFVSQNEVTPPPKGGGVGYHLFWVRRVCPVRSQPGHSGPTGPVWSFGGVVPLPRPLTGHKSPHRAEFGLPVFVCPRCAHRHILASVFQNPFWEALFFVTSTSAFEAAPPLFPGKQKAGISSSLCKNIYSSTTFWLNRIKMLAACALVVVPAGSKALSS